VAKAKEFERALDQLFRERTHWLRTAVGHTKPGPAPQFTKAKVEKKLSQLENLARVILCKKRAEQEFDKIVESYRQWHIKKGKGWRWRERRASFGRWYDTQVKASHCIYSFWDKNRRCLYIGRSINGKGRPQAHFEKFWFPRATRIDIAIVSTPSQVHRAECLAIDLWDPLYNDRQSAKHKYQKKCPVCSDVKEISAELRSLFKLK